MSRAVTVLMDLPPDDASHRYTIDALHHAIAHLDADVSINLTTTDSIGSIADGVVIGPGSPYRDPGAAERVIESARRGRIPLIGT